MFNMKKMIKRFFTGIFDYDSCTIRKYFWLFMIAWVVLMGILYFLLYLFGQAVYDGNKTVFYVKGIESVIWIIPNILFFLHFIAISIRRLHDSGHNGAWVWLIVIPMIGMILLLIFMLLPTNKNSEYQENYFES